MLRVEPVLMIGLLLALVPACTAAGAERPQIDAGKSFDLQGFLDQELTGGKKRIVIPPGRHRVTPKNRAHVLLVGLNDVEIVADGAELICTETTRALTIQKCTNLKLTGLTIDYDPLPFSQGRITGMSADGMVHDVELFSDYPQDGDITGRKYEIFKPDTRTLRFGSYHGCTVEKLGGGKLRITKADHYRRQKPERVGDIVAIDCLNAPGGTLPHAVYLSTCSDVTLERVTVHASNNFGFLEVDCNRSVYRECAVDRRAGEADLIKHADPRVRSLNADAFHSKHAQVGPTYHRCRARFQGDDCVAINGDYHLVMSTHGRGLRVLAKRDFNLAADDLVELVTFEGARLPEAKVVAVQEDGNPAEDEIGYVRKQQLYMNRGDNPKYYLVKAYRVTLDREVDLPRGSLICATTRVGNGFKVIDCDFGFNRSRGILVKASHGEIRGNRLEETQGPAILLAPEFFWLEAGSGVDVRVEGNTIVRCAATAIEVSAHGGSGKLAPAGAHADIRVLNNRIEDSPAPQIRVTSTDRLRIEGNMVRAQAGAALKLEQAIVRENCSNETLKENRIEP